MGRGRTNGVDDIAPGNGGSSNDRSQNGNKSGGKGRGSHIECFGW